MSLNGRRVLLRERLARPLRMSGPVGSPPTARSKFLNGTRRRRFASGMSQCLTPPQSRARSFGYARMLEATRYLGGLAAGATPLRLPQVPQPAPNASDPSPSCFEQPHTNASDASLSCSHRGLCNTGYTVHLSAPPACSSARPSPSSRTYRGSLTPGTCPGIARPRCPPSFDSRSGNQGSGRRMGSQISYGSMSACRRRMPSRRFEVLMMRLRSARRSVGTETSRNRAPSFSDTISSSHCW